MFYSSIFKRWTKNKCYSFHGFRLEDTLPSRNEQLHTSKMCQFNEIHETENGRQNPFPKTDVTIRKKGLYMDEAISEIKFGLFNYILIFTCGLIMAALIFETVGITFVLPVSQCDLNLTTSEKGILGAASFFGIICTSHLWGFLADTKGRRSVILPTLFIAFLMSFMSSFVQNFYLLTVLRFLNGFFISGSSATIYVYLGEFHNNKQRSRTIMGSSVVLGVLCILMPVIAWLVINEDWQFNIPLIDIAYKPWRLFLVICTLPGLFAFLIMLYLPESPKFLLGQGKQAEAYRVLQHMNEMNSGKNSPLEPFEIHEEAESIENRQRILDSKNSRFPLLTSAWNQTVPLFKRPYLFPTVLICTIQFSIFYTCQGFSVFHTEILNKIATNVEDLVNDRVGMCDIINLKQMRVGDTYDGQTHETCTTKLEVTALQQGVVLQVLYAVGYFLSSLLISRISKFPIIFSILAGTGFCGLVCMFTDIPLLQVCLFTVHISSGVGSNVLNTATVELYPTNLRAMAICISLMFGRLGSMTGSNVVASLLENQQCVTAFYLSGMNLIAAGALAFFIPNIHQKVIKPDKS